MNQTERRKNERASAVVRFWYRMPWSREWRLAHTSDIGAGGLSFTLPAGLTFRGLPVEVAVDVPKAAFRTKGRVVSTRKADEGGRVVALSFTSLPQALGARVAAFVSRIRLIGSSNGSRMIYDF